MLGIVLFTVVFIGTCRALAENSSLEFILPKVFGNHTTDSLSAAPACGTNLAAYQGIYAKSNGNYQGTGTSCSTYGTYGSQYQCVEYAQRVFGTLHGTTPIWYGNAIDLCTSHPSNVAQTSSPVAGDLVVFNVGTYGHVAVITSKSSTSVSVVEQNAATTGTNTYSLSSVKCYLHYTGSNPPPPPPPPSGSCPNLGYYCGNDGLGKDANTLYYCSSKGATPTVKTACSFTCVTNVKGYDDYCSTSGTCSTVVTGYYCGSDKVKGDPSVLYLCKSSKPQGAKKCGNGCVTASSGYDDYCK